MKRKRATRAVRRANSPLLGEVMRRLDVRTWCSIGLVLDDEFDNHGGKDVTLRVELQPGGEVVRCRLGSIAAGPGFGVWSVPPAGAEVGVIFPDGEFDAGGIIVATLSSGEIPSGVDAATIVIVVPPGGKVFVRDGDGATEPLVRLSEHLAHTHPTGTGPSGIPVEQSITGTTALEAG